MGPKRFSHPVEGWADSPLMHGTSIPFEIYAREYILHDQDYDGTEKLWSMKKFDERDYLNPEFDPTGILTKFRAGDQGVELYWANYLVTNFGLEKLYSEYYRRRASTGDFRIALHQTYGKPYDELLQDAAAWISTVTTHEEYRLLFADAEEFVANLNQSFNVSFLQVRNSSTPNNRFQTIYTFVGEGEPSGIGDQWIPVTHGDDVQVVMGENTTSNLSSSATGQLVVNGHKAYYYSQDTSVHHSGGLAASKDWSAFTRRGELTSNLWFPVFIYDHDGDGLPDDYDPDYQDLFFTRDGRYKEDGWPGSAEYSGYGQVVSVLKPSGDNDGDGVINGEDAFPMDAFETIDTDGDGIADFNGGNKPPATGWDIDGDGDNILDSVKDPTLKPTPFSLKDNKATAQGFTFDLGYPVVKSKAFSLEAYMEYNKLIFPKIKGDNYYSRKAMNGTGITIPGVRASIFSFLNVSFEYRLKNGYFAPQFFDGSYDLSRVVAEFSNSGTVIRTKDQVILVDSSSTSGLYGSASANVFNLVSFNAAYASMKGDGDLEFNSFNALINVNAENIPKLSVAQAYYQRNNDKNPFDFGNPTINTIFGYKVGYEVNAGVSLIWDFRQFYRDTGNGLEPVKQTTIETAFNF